MISNDVITAGVEEQTLWWINQRQEKLIKQLSGSMSLNPFLVPFLYDYHNLDSLDNFVELILASHLMIGHNTGFGKLIDEKILPQVFGTIKLDKGYRANNGILINDAFNEIDHLVTNSDGVVELLSLKAGKWTIQLSMAKNLNASFSDILRFYGTEYQRIIVGVYYGNRETLTDKYDILRGINRGANHNVRDITENVDILAGQEFWTWLGRGNNQTQQMVLQGILNAVRSADIRNSNQRLMDNFKRVVGESFNDTLGQNDDEKWQRLLRSINS
jgi:hypothetical protein